MNNEWVSIAQQLPWRSWETLYVAMFPSNTGNVAKPCRTVMGSLILQMRLGFTDREDCVKRFSQMIVSNVYRSTCMIRKHIRWCFLQAFFGESCKIFLEKIASPFWRKLQWPVHSLREPQPATADIG